MAWEEDVFINLSIPSLPLSISQLIEWATRLHWWEWLILAKAMLLFWVLNITVILPSLYMQVMLYTDEMNSRHAPSATVALLWEGHHLLTWAFNPTFNLAPLHQLALLTNVILTISLLMYFPTFKDQMTPLYWGKAWSARQKADN